MFQDFCQQIDVPHIYSIVKAVKANNLKTFEYSFLEELLPWAEKLPTERQKA